MDLISRQDAVDAVVKMFEAWYGGSVLRDREIRARFDALPSAQPEYRLDEWCTNCKEYDQEKHCCPRFNRVIQTTLQEMQSERKIRGEPMDLISRQAAIDAIKRAIWDKQIAKDAIDAVCNTPSAQERKKGKWILEKIYEDEYGNAKFNYFCSECGASAYEFHQPFCHKCGSDMRGED